METTTAMTVNPARASGVTRADAGVFLVKLGALAAASSLAVAWIVSHRLLAALPAEFVLGLMFAHAVELQHQALHGSGLRGAAANRVVGVLLGLPMLVSFSRYRALHMLHHRFLGTDRDTEFFEYSYNGRLTFGMLALSAFNVRRWILALRDIGRSLSPRSRYDKVIVNAAIHRRIRFEYRLTALLLATLFVLSLASRTPLVLTLWLIPLVFAEPVHFAIELPEHIFCDRTSREVFKNTRSIKGSWFSYWLTNGNNFHVEHHYRMAAPINRLPALHEECAPRLEHYNATYWSFYGKVLRCAWAARHANRSGSTPPASATEGHRA